MFAVAATSTELARRAVLKAKISYKDLKPIVTIQEGAGSTLQLDTFDPDDRRYWTPPICTHVICE